MKKIKKKKKKRELQSSRRKQSLIIAMRRGIGQKNVKRMKRENFVNLTETFGFFTNVGYVIATSHGPTHQNNIHDWILDSGAWKHMTNQRDWFSSL